MAEVTTEGPEILKEPPQIEIMPEIMPTARTPPKIPEVLKEPP